MPLPPSRWNSQSSTGGMPPRFSSSRRATRNSPPGSHAALRMLAVFSVVRACRLVPSAPISQRFSIPFSSDVNAIVFPSGAKRG